MWTGQAGGRDGQRRSEVACYTCRGPWSISGQSLIAQLLAIANFLDAKFAYGRIRLASIH
ncbi:unnamed protein product [Clonostachys rosea f. rosea IK726]|uniref:Uncharacterized protein n=1 Tax=Clonostachys rosea f. rosea IK726 TaxID=1349383 RepID=A0ACA9UQU3_BIOOC|nr:unnamed protein product [Clonostachys rosea f. rosea IK726]